MGKLDRVTAKIFGETASTTNTPVEIGQFGSAKLGTYNATSDIAQIQNLPAWSNGWIDAVTPQEQFPPLPEMTGVHKVLSYQNAYLLQQGIAEWDEATAYYIDNFCAKNGNIYTSLSDDNLGNDPEIDTDNWKMFAPGTDFANRDIDNLTAFGNARLQYAPFSVNAAVLDSDKNNNTLYLPPGTSVEIDWQQPILSSNGTWNGNAFAVCSSAEPPSGTWNLFDGQETQRVRWHCSTTIPAYVYAYFPEGTGIRPSKFDFVGYKASDSNLPTRIIVYGTNTDPTVNPDDQTSWVALGTQTEFKSRQTTTLNVTANSYYRYLVFAIYGSQAAGGYAQANLLSMHIYGKYTIASSSTLLVNPCTITTCSGQTVKLENNNYIDVSTYSNGNYYVFRSISDQLKLVAENQFEIAKKSTKNCYLDISTCPSILREKIPGTTTYTSISNYVCIGECSIYNHAVSSVTNYPINNNFHVEQPHVSLVDEYTSNNIIIRVWSDGLVEQSCVQYAQSSAGAYSITYPVTYKSPPVLIVNLYADSTSSTSITVRNNGYSRSTSGFTIYMFAGSSISFYARGYANV